MLFGRLLDAGLDPAHHAAEPFADLLDLVLLALHSDITHIYVIVPRGIIRLEMAYS